MGYPASKGAIAVKLNMKETTKKIYLSVCLGLLSLTLTASTKPNIIIIYSDDHGYTDLGIHGIDGNGWKDIIVPGKSGTHIIWNDGK